MEVHAHIRNNKDEGILPIAKHRKLYKQNKKIRKNVKVRAKDKLLNNGELMKHKFSP